MHVNTYISALIQYGLDRGLFQPCDKDYMTNRVLEVLQLDSVESAEAAAMPLEELLHGLLEDAVARGVCRDDVTSRDLFDTKLMGVLTPLPREVIAKFDALYRNSPEAATDWYYQFSQDTDYIRTYRIEKDMRWKTATEYGDLDITINLSKPEKDPKAIAAAKAAPQTNYPKCVLCKENEGYAGRMNHPARQNLRLIPVEVGGAAWQLQYSPYVYYPEHCILLSGQHSPMVVDEGTMEKLLDFVTQFPHYFMGSNADLPIVGGSILSHEHFQGGRYCFPMERAPVERPVVFQGYEGVEAGIVKWPMSVIRLRGNRDSVRDLAVKILRKWKGYTDEAAFLYAQTDGVPHNAITPIARRRGEDYELDLVLRNNITTPERPLGVYHPRPELHHIKKENIGLIEVMGLAVLPGRLKQELTGMEEALLKNLPLTGELEKHADWAHKLAKEYDFTPDNISDILKREVGLIFSRVLEDAGVYKRTAEGVAAFDRFIDFINEGT